MSKLEFFCNRPTLVALIGFGCDLSSGNPVQSNVDVDGISDDKSLMNKEKAEDKGLVKGLLGYGKHRVVFYLNMKIDSVTVFLNKEDGSQLAMLVQERFLLDLKVWRLPSIMKLELHCKVLLFCISSIVKLNYHFYSWGFFFFMPFRSLCLCQLLYLIIFNCFFKIHPGSLSIEGTLGNFRLCDMSLGDDHSWSWLCDIRNPGLESLIKVVT